MAAEFVWDLYPHCNVIYDNYNALALAGRLPIDYYTLSVQ
jgi:hypothetical protein